MCGTQFLDLPFDLLIEILNEDAIVLLKLVGSCHVLRKKLDQLLVPLFQRLLGIKSLKKKTALIKRRKRKQERRKKKGTKQKKENKKNIKFLYRKKRMEKMSEHEGEKYNKKTLKETLFQ